MARKRKPSIAHPEDTTLRAGDIARRVNVHFAGGLSDTRPGLLEANAELRSEVKKFAAQLGNPRDTAIISPLDLGAMVRAARKQKKMSQTEFADLAGVGRRFLSELESGKPTSEIGRVLMVLAAAGIDLVARER